MLILGIALFHPKMKKAMKKQLLPNVSFVNIEGNTLRSFANHSVNID